MNQSLQKLQNFRNEAYQLLGPAKDATFDLMDCGFDHPKSRFFCRIIPIDRISEQVAEPLGRPR